MAENMHWRRKWHPTPVFLPGESHGRGAWWAAVYGARKQSSLSGKESAQVLGKIEGRRRRGQQRMRWLDGTTDSMYMSLSKVRALSRLGAELELRRSGSSLGPSQ